MTSRQLEIRVTLADGRVGYSSVMVPDVDKYIDSPAFAARYLTPAYAAATMYAESRVTNEGVRQVHHAHRRSRPKGRRRG